jgi:hypothetical protein
VGLAVVHRAWLLHWYLWRWKHQALTVVGRLLWGYGPPRGPLVLFTGGALIPAYIVCLLDPSVQLMVRSVPLPAGGAIYIAMSFLPCCSAVLWYVILCRHAIDCSGLYLGLLPDRYGRDLPHGMLSTIYRSSFLMLGQVDWDYLPSY